VVGVVVAVIAELAVVGEAAVVTVVELGVSVYTSRWTE
jgi:hypothetical protein